LSVRELLAKTLNRDLKRKPWPAAAALECTDHAAFEALILADERAGLACQSLSKHLDEELEVADWQRELLFSATKQRADREGLLQLLEGTWRALRRE